jgi:hypothetical protein
MIQNTSAFHVLLLDVAEENLAKLADNVMSGSLAKRWIAHKVGP